VVRWIRGIYWVLIPLTLGFMALHNLLDLFAKARRRAAQVDSGQQVVRMNLWFRIAHWGVMLSFPTLVFTGFALKYPDSWWSAPFLLWGKHEAFRGQLHRAAALVLVAATLYHFGHLAVNKRDRIFLQAMLPKWKDVTDLIGVLAYNLGARKEEPRFAKFNYAEKLEYWAFLRGTAVMALSGFLLWFNSFALRHFPKWITDAATAVHWYEALLATFSILLWHSYNGDFRSPRLPYGSCLAERQGLRGPLPADATCIPESAATSKRRGLLPQRTARRERSGGSPERSVGRNGRDHQAIHLRYDT
jgi:formate dehydrogenase gamma subunit